MANNCSGFVHLQGERVQEALDFINSVWDKREEGCGVQFIPNENERYLFDVDVINEDGHISFWTKWTPEVGQIISLAKMFDLEFTYEFDEPGCELFGEYYYTPNNELSLVELSHDDFAEFEYDEEKDAYIFRGEEWESDNEIKGILLNELKGNLQ